MVTKHRKIRPGTGWAFAGVLTACMVGGTAAAQINASEQAALVRETCLNVMRIQQGFVPFDACVKSLAKTLRNSSPMVEKGTSASYAIGQPAETSYSESTAAERRRKEEYSCAQLGLLPGSPGFGQCVAELDGSLRSVEQSE